MDEMGRDTESDQEMNKETEEVKLEQCRQVANEQLDGWRNALNEVVFQVEATTPSTTTVLLSQPVRDSGDCNEEVEILEVSECEGKGGDHLWILLKFIDDEGNGQPTVVFSSPTWSAQADLLRFIDRVVIVRVPDRFLAEGDIYQMEVTIKWEQSGRRSRSFSFTYVSALPGISRQTLFDFATNGDPLALIAPAAQLLPAIDEHGCTALHVAAKNKQSFALKTLLTALKSCGREQGTLNAINDRGQTALHCAVRSGDADSVHYLVSAGASRSIPDCNANTAVHYLGDAYNDAIYQDILDPPEQAENLDLGARNDQGQTAVHVAVKRLKLTLIECLLDAGAPVDLPDCEGQTPLHSAVQLNDIEIVITLLQKGANPNAVTKSGRTPLHLAYDHRNPDMMAKLIEAGADPDLSSTEHDVRSVRDLVSDDAVLTSVLRGEWQVSAPTNGRANNVEEDEASSSNLLDEAIGGGRDDDQEEDEPVSKSSTRRMQDDVSSLDYLTRLRLSKLLDAEDKWTKLAEKLNCQHMIEFIKVCTEDGSPTMILLDQYEQMPNSNISAVISVMEELGESMAVNLLHDRFIPNNHHL